MLKGNKKGCYQHKHCAWRIARTLIIFTCVLKKQEDFVWVAAIKRNDRFSPRRRAGKLGYFEGASDGLLSKQKLCLAHC